jgi:hypothetical protein
VWLKHVAIKRLQIEGQLAEMFRLEPLHLKLKCNETAEATMEEELVKRKGPR